MSAAPRPFRGDLLVGHTALAGGYLSGKYSAGENSAGGRQTELDFPPINRDRGEPLIEVLRSVAAKHERQSAQIAIAWLLAQPVVSTVLVRAKRIDPAATKRPGNRDCAG